jgi:hypothetical protein
MKNQQEFFQDVAVLSGGGAGIEYTVEKGDSVKYKKCLGVIKS